MDQPWPEFEALKQAQEHLGAWQKLFLKTAEDPVAIATIFLVLATLTLAAIAIYQLREARISSERQLRAYVYVSNAKFSFPSETTCEVHFRFVNFGQTPAHDVEARAIVQACDWRGKDTVVPVAESWTPFGSMGPQNDYYDNHEREIEIAKADLRNGTKAVYLVGMIRYRTVFDNELKETNFRFYIGGDLDIDGDEMSADDEGNNAT